MWIFSLMYTALQTAACIQRKNKLPYSFFTSQSNFHGNISVLLRYYCSLTLLKRELANTSSDWGGNCCP